MAINGIEIAKVTAEDLLIRDAGDGLDLMGTVYYQGFDRIVLNEKNIAPSFLI